MTNILLTLAIAFIVIVLAIALLGISWLLTGKLNIKAGACGRDPTKTRADDCGSEVSCGLCENKKEKKPDGKL